MKDTKNGVERIYEETCCYLQGFVSERFSDEYNREESIKQSALKDRDLFSLHPNTLQVEQL